MFGAISLAGEWPNSNDLRPARFTDLRAAALNIDHVYGYAQGGIGRWERKRDRKALSELALTILQIEKFVNVTWVIVCDSANYVRTGTLPDQNTIS